jgi:hypothetical protein
VAITNRTQFKEYCLRRLGGGAIKINVTEDQIQDRIDDALQYWNEFHADGYVETMLKHQITQDDITNGWVPMPAHVMYVAAVLPIFEKASSIKMFDIRYQMRLHDIFDLNFAGSLSHFVQTQQYITMMGDILNAHPRIAHTRRGRKVYIELKNNEIRVGDYLVFHVYIKVDPEEDSDVWNDKWLKAYASALIKRQWGENLSKYEGVLLIGGVTVSGGSILDAAMADIDQLEDEMRSRYSEPIDFVIG